MKKIIHTLIVSLSISLLMNGCIHREIFVSSSRNNINTIPTYATTDTPTKFTNPKAKNNDTVVVPRIDFPQSEYAQLPKNGNGTVKGSIFLSDAYGEKIYGKQTRLYLNPITSYSKQWYSESYIGGYKMAKADKKLFNYLRFTASNKEGKFAFYGVPSGSYYVIGVVKCGKQCGYDSSRNVRIAKEVHISGSDTVSIDLSKMVD